MPTPPDSDCWEHYAELAAQYYIAARFAVLAQHVPLCGNQMHHAIELLLKCGVIKAGTVPTGAAPAQFLKNTYGHKLGALWTAFKAHHSSTALAHFDRLIDSLDPWEEIRYPKLGITISLDFGPPVTIPGLPHGSAMMGTRQYRVDVIEFDRFFKEIWSLIAISTFLFEIETHVKNRPLAKAAYEDLNQHRIV